jgi:hypothetical protein
LKVRTIKKLTISLIISGVLALGITLNAQAFGPTITTVNTANDIDIALTTEQSHTSRNFVNYLNVGSKNLNLQSEKISSQIIGDVSLATTATTAEGVFPLGGYNFTDNGTISTAGVGMHFQSNNDSNMRFSLAWEHYNINLNEIYNIPATNDSVNITSIGVTFDF